MSSKPTIGNEVSVDEQTEERSEDGFEIVEETPELRPTVEHEIQAKVDTNHPDATPEGLTLVAEERMEAREMEIERTQGRFDRRKDSDRELRTRRVATGRPDRRGSPRTVVADVRDVGLRVVPRRPAPLAYRRSSRVSVRSASKASRSRQRSATRAANAPSGSTAVYPSSVTSNRSRSVSTSDSSCAR